MATLKAEIARTPSQHAMGLMGRKHLPKNAGMLFDFGSTRPLSFWMRNTYIPLQIAFINNKGRITQIEEMIPHSTRSIQSIGSSRYALEVNEGWFENNGIQVGAQVTMPFPAPQTDPSMAPQQDQQQQAPGPSPDLLIEQSYKEVLTAADLHGLQVILRYIPEESDLEIERGIQPPYTFDSTEEGDPEGLVTAWCLAGYGDKPAGYRSFLIDGIISIHDVNGQPLNNVQAVETAAADDPLPTEDWFEAAGMMDLVVEQPDETEDNGGTDAGVQDERVA